MAVLFLEPGGDCDFGTALWPTVLSGPAVATDFVHGSHIKSIKYRPSQSDELQTPFAADAGGRYSIWLYWNVLPNATATIFGTNQSSTSNNVIRVRMTSAGQLQLANNTVQIGSSGSTLSAGVWYRLCLAWTITSTSVNQIRLFLSVAGAAATTDITGTNLSLSVTGTAQTRLGNISSNTAMDMRSSDHYIDDSTALTDIGNVWVTAKRPVSNGTTNGFTAQIGSGGSGYGTGHSPQVNERPLSTTNGWSMIGAGSAVTEEYTIEGQSVGDINITGSTIVDFMGWIDAKALVNETASIVVAGATSNVALTSTITIFRKVAGSTTYPAGGTDIGLITTTALTTVSLYECGIAVAYIPSASANLFGRSSLDGLSIFGTHQFTRTS